MPVDESEPTVRPSAGRARLRRSGRKLVRVGALLLVVSLVVTLISGFATRSLITHLQTNSAELLDGTARVPLTAGTERTLYVTGGLVAPGELVPSSLDQISCEVTGPDEQPVPFVDRTDDAVGVDLVAARIQVVGHFTAEQDGTHLVECEGLGVVLSPGLSAVSVVLRIGGLVVGSLGTVLGVTMLVIGGVLLMLRRGDQDDDDGLDDDLPPEEGADRWWDGAESGDGRSGDGDSADADADADDYVELSEDELASFSDEELAELVASGAIVFVDDDAEDADDDAPGPADEGPVRP